MDNENVGVLDGRSLTKTENKSPADASYEVNVELPTRFSKPIKKKIITMKVPITIIVASTLAAFAIPESANAGGGCGQGGSGYYRGGGSYSSYSGYSRGRSYGYSRSSSRYSGSRHYRTGSSYYRSSGYRTRGNVSSNYYRGRSYGSRSYSYGSRRSYSRYRSYGGYSRSRSFGRCR